MKTLEHVAVTVTITHPCRGALEIVLVCPSGMASVIGARRVIDRYARTLALCPWLVLLLYRDGEESAAVFMFARREPTGYQDWTFSTVRCWGERAEGRYTLRISDHRKAPLTPPPRVVTPPPPGLSLCVDAGEPSSQTVASRGVLDRWTLTLYGSSMTYGEVKARQR